MTGDQHAKFRQFKNFGDIFIWDFTNDIFRIHNICMGMTKKIQKYSSKFRIPIAKIKNEQKENSYYFENLSEETYIPYNIDEIHSENDLVKRLIPIDEKTNLLPAGISYYYDSFSQGASVYPAIIFV